MEDIFVLGDEIFENNPKTYSEVIIEDEKEYLSNQL